MSNHLIVVVPGIGGSVLARLGDRDDVVWDAGKRDIGDLVVRPKRMSVNEWPRLEPIGLTRSTKLLGFTIVAGYERLLASLGAFGKIDGHGDPKRPVLGADVVVAPYDFRLGVVDAAKRLDAVVNAHFGDVSEAERAGRVVVVAHSLGGLVARQWLGVMGRWRWCRSLITLGTPHRGAPKALDWMVNGVRVLGAPLPWPTRLLREWTSVAELLPRYEAVTDLTAGRAVYPHELPIPVLSTARAAYEMHLEIERAWTEMPRGGPEVVACLGWSHPTPDAATWDGTTLTVAPTAPAWLDRTGWENDFGDGTVPAISAVPIEMSNHQNDLIRLRARHVPMVDTPGLVALLTRYRQRRDVGWIRGEEGTAAIGLDLPEMHAVGEPIPVTVHLRQVPSDVSRHPVFATLTPSGDDLAEPVEVTLDWAADRRLFTGELPGQPEGLFDVRICARAVPGAGDLSAQDTIAVVGP